MDVSTIKLLDAGPDHIAHIGELAKRIWWQHYPSVISTEQITYMLDKMYNPDSLLQQMHESGHRFSLILNTTHPLGFISVSESSPHQWFIHKFYIDQEYAAKGTGSRVFQLLLEQLQPETIRLTVNRQNYKSVNFYFKNGFKIEKVADFDIGNGYVMNDFVMFWKAS